MLAINSYSISKNEFIANYINVLHETKAKLILFDLYEQTTIIRREANETPPMLSKDGLVYFDYQYNIKYKIVRIYKNVGWHT